MSSFEGLAGYGQRFSHYMVTADKWYEFETVAFCSTFKAASHEVGVKWLDADLLREIKDDSPPGWAVAYKDWSVQYVPEGGLLNHIKNLAGVSYHLA